MSSSPPLTRRPLRARVLDFAAGVATAVLTGVLVQLVLLALRLK